MTDFHTHAPGDSMNEDKALNAALGSGLTVSNFRKIEENAKRLLKKNHP